MPRRTIRYVSGRDHSEAIPEIAGIAMMAIPGVGEAKELLAAGDVGAEASQGIRITQEGLDIASSHLAQFGEHAPNAAMLDRLGSAVGTRVTGADANFYLHEISESTMMA